MRRTLPLALCCLTLLAGDVSAAGDGAATTAGSTVRVKDIASLQGVSSTPLIGYGIVAGLAKTGDRRQTIFSAQTLASMLERFGVGREIDPLAMGGGGEHLAAQAARLTWAVAGKTLSSILSRALPL